MAGREVGRGCLCLARARARARERSHTHTPRGKREAPLLPVPLCFFSARNSLRTVGAPLCAVEVKGGRERAGALLLKVGLFRVFGGGGRCGRSLFFGRRREGGQAAGKGRPPKTPRAAALSLCSCWVVRALSLFCICACVCSSTRPPRVLGC
jgi:hypothetical protein